jgi:hypothetical protein
MRASRHAFCASTPQEHPMTSFKQAGPLGVAANYHWLATEQTVDMALPARPPRACHAGHAAEPGDRPAPHGHRGDRPAERLLHRRRLGRPHRRQLPGRPRAHRAPCRPCCSRCARRACRWSGELGQPAGPGQHAAQPDPLYKPHGHGVGLGDPLPNGRGNVLEKDSWAAAIVDELPVEPQDIRVDKYRIRASGTRRWTASCATWASRPCCSPAATPTNACCTR